MRDLSGIPPAMPDIERTSRPVRLLARLGVVGRSTHPARGGDVGKGSRPATRSIVPHSHTRHQSQPEADGQGGSPANEARAGTRVVAVMDAPWDHCVWAKLDNGLQLRIDHDEAARAPADLIDVGRWTRRLNPIGQVSILLGLPVPPYGFGAVL